MSHRMLLEREYEDRSKVYDGEKSGFSSISLEGSEKRLRRSTRRPQIPGQGILIAGQTDGGLWLLKLP